MTQNNAELLWSLEELAAQTQEIDPINISILDPDAFIQKYGCQPVTSTFIMEPSTMIFDDNGLFSERIFGMRTAPERLITFGYVNLKIKVFHPRIYSNLVRLKGLYGEIMSGKSFARFDPEIKDFVSALRHEEGAGTGYAFFLSHYHDIEFQKSKSLTRNDRITILERYKDKVFLDKWLIAPAGIRDIQQDETTSARTMGDLNQYYVSLITYARSIPDQEPSEDMISMFDAVRYSIQAKLVKINEYFQNMIEGKTGFMEKKFGARNLALGTANVVSPARMAGETVEDSKFPKVDQSMVPLYQAAKMFQPKIIWAIRTLFYNQVFNEATTQIALIDKNYKLGYHEISAALTERYFTTDSMIRLLNRYADLDFRSKPVAIKLNDNQYYYLFLVYDDGTDIWQFRDLDAFKQYYESTERKFDPNKVRPMTWMEMLYISTAYATRGTYMTSTRYPVLHPGSVFVAKTYVISTDPSRKIKYHAFNSDEYTEFAEYPILDEVNSDSARLHPSRISGDTGLNADFDGDRMNFNGIMTDEAIKAAQEYNESLESILLPDGRLAVGFDTYLIKLGFHCLSSGL